MSEMSLHGEWLSLMDISGPFLAEPVLKDAFPQGLEEVEPGKRKLLRQAYDEWRDALELGDDDLTALHKAWIDLVLQQGLELDEDGDGDILKSGDDLPDNLAHKVAEHGVTLRPDYAVVDDQTAKASLLLISVYQPGTDLNEPLKGDGWAASPAERMVELCRARETRLGLVTNGEHWMLVDAPVGAVTTFASWFARLWSPEPKTLQSFVNLLGVRRFFVGSDEQLPALLDASLKMQDEVTDALGEQVRRAVEVLIQALDRADVDRNRELLKGIEPTDLYEAGLTVMMRIVFLLSAEERGLLLLGDERYEANYAVSTLRMQLRAESEEILERRFDAWARLLSIFRAVYGGIEHEEMRLPALGGSLFDPNRFPFLEGRPRGSDWRTDHAVPLPIDNRTVLLLLDAVQLFQGRTLSYRALDVEQIGYVYEGLLERTVVRAKNITLDLDATKNSKKPWVTLEEIEAAKAESDDAVSKLLKERTGSSASRVKNDLSKPLEAADSDKLLTACHADASLRDRIKPYFHFLRTDRWGYPLVYPVGTFMVTTGTDRRETGTHYTPKSLTESVVKETLEPVVYIGPLEGKPRDEWVLKSPAELLDLKICDPAMGSGAFLVQVCRYLSDRLVESWSEIEKAGRAVTADGAVVERQNGFEPLRDDQEERLLTARRLIAERCLYGVDVNPLAVELAKLSVWLITLAKDRPFGFLDHNLRSGDSLLGIRHLDQLLCLDMEPSRESSPRLFAAGISDAVSEAVSLRSELRRRPILDIRDVQAMADLDKSAREKLKTSELIADALVAEALMAGKKSIDATSLSIEVGKVFSGELEAAAVIRKRALEGLSKDLPNTKTVRKPFHWPLEFPEVFGRENGGFDAFVGNPPFVGGQMLSGAFGTAYQTYLVQYASVGEKSSVDLLVYFILQCFISLRHGGCQGFVARRSISEGKNREAGLGRLADLGGAIYCATTNLPWPGKASVVVHLINISKSDWFGDRTLNSKVVDTISADLTDLEFWEAKPIAENLGRAFQGSILLGEGFKVDEETAKCWLDADAKYEDVLFPFIGGGEVNKDPAQSASTWAINFFDWTESKSKDFPLAYEKVLLEVKPERQRKKPNGEFKLRKPLPERWWQYGEKRPALYHAIGRGSPYLSHPDDWSKVLFARVLVISTGVTKYPAFSFLPSNYIYSNKLCVIADERHAMFAMLSSDIHAIWAWSQKTSLGGDLHSMVYAHGNVFETFPFPEGFLENGDKALDEVGENLHDARTDIMVERNIGLTKFYNVFHDPENTDEDIKSVRDLQVKLNIASSRLFGLDESKIDTGFHDVGYLPIGHNTRFTISETARIEVLRKLSRLNRERYEASQQSSSSNGRSAPIASNQDQPDDLFTAQGGSA